MAQALQGRFGGVHQFRLHTHFLEQGQVEGAVHGVVFADEDAAGLDGRTVVGCRTLALEGLTQALGEEVARYGFAQRTGDARLGEGLVVSQGGAVGEDEGDGGRVGIGQGGQVSELVAGEAAGAAHPHQA